ncbi:MIF4G domain protein [Trichuris suis]|nr:MIF4G domain protein [Trichuris suis]
MRKYHSLKHTLRSENVTFGYKPDPKLSQVVTSIYTVAYALDSMYKDVCTGYIAKGVCPAMVPVDGSKLFQYMLKTEFRDFSGQSIYFDKNGDPPARYDILNYQGKQAGYVTVGTWGHVWREVEPLNRTSHPVVKYGSKLRIDRRKILWHNGRSGSSYTPVAKCSYECGIGEIKKIQAMKCCWTCVPCFENEYLLNEYKCKECPVGSWPVENRTACYKLDVEYMRWGDAEAIVCVVFACAGILATVFTTTIFVMKNTTPVVKATTRELSYMILGGLLLCYATTFIIVTPPCTVTCVLLRMVPCLAFAMIYGALFTKTNRIARILAASKKIITKRRRFLSTGAQVVITCILIGVELVITVVFLILEPPAAEFDHSIPRRVLLVCRFSKMGFFAPFGFDLFLVSMCTLYAIKTRNLPENFNEAKFIGFTMYTTCIVWLAFLAIYFGSNKKDTTMCICFSLSASVALVLLFFPKLYVILWRPEKNVRSYFKTTTTIRCHFGTNQTSGSETHSRVPYEFEANLGNQLIGSGDSYSSYSTQSSPNLSRSDSKISHATAALADLSRKESAVPEQEARTAEPDVERKSSIATELATMKDKVTGLTKIQEIPSPSTSPVSMRRSRSLWRKFDPLLRNPELSQRWKSFRSRPETVRGKATPTLLLRVAAERLDAVRQFLDERSKQCAEDGAHTPSPPPADEPTYCEASADATSGRVRKGRGHVRFENAESSSDEELSLKDGAHLIARKSPPLVMNGGIDLVDAQVQTNMFMPTDAASPQEGGIECALLEQWRKQLRSHSDTSVSVMAEGRQPIGETLLPQVYQMEYCPNRRNLSLLRRFYEAQLRLLRDEGDALEKCVLFLPAKNHRKHSPNVCLKSSDQFDKNSQQEVENHVLEPAIRQRVGSTANAVEVVPSCNTITAYNSWPILYVYSNDLSEVESGHLILPVNFVACCCAPGKRQGAKSINRFLHNNIGACFRIMDGRKRLWKPRQWGGGGGFKRKRELTPEKPSLEELLVQFVGNVCRTVIRIAEQYKELFLSVLNMPYKVTVFSALVGLMNLKNYSFGNEFVGHLLSTLCNFLDKSHWEDAQIITIFLCSLANCHCITSVSCMSILRSYLSLVEQDNKAIVRDLCFSFILRTLPIVGEQLSNDMPDELESFYKALEKYESSRDRQSYLRLIQVWTSDKPHRQEEFLDCLWKQIKALRMNEWNDSYYMRYEKSHGILLSNSIAHSVDDFVVPINFDVAEFPFRITAFRMFDASDCPEGKGLLPDIHSIERFLLEQDLMWLIDKNYTDPKKCAIELSNYYCRGNMPLSYITLEIIFGLMFRLPKPPKIELFYGCLLIELCKAQVYTVPQVVAQATEILFQRLASMNIACIDRFVNWFAFHLSNFRYCWTWSDWTSCCDQEPYSPQLSFVTELLSRCQSFSYHERIIEILPDELKHLLPPAPKVFDKFSMEGAEPSGLALELQEAIKARKEPEKVLSILLQQGEGSENGDGPVESVEYKTEVVISQLLVIGQRTMSQTLSLLTRFAPVLDQLVKNNENAQLSLLNAVRETWPTFEQRIGVVVDKLFRLEIVPAPVIVKWVFSKEMKNEFLKQYVWEIVSSTFDKLCINFCVLSDKLKAVMGEDMSPEESGDPAQALELQEGLEACLGAQKAFIFTLFQHFIITLSEHLLTADESGDRVSDWYRIVFGRMCQFFTTQCVEVQRHSKELGEVLFTGDLDPRIIEPYKWFLAFMN